MNRSDWLDLLIDGILSMLIAYAKKHSHDAAQEIVSLVSYGLAEHEKQSVGVGSANSFPTAQQSKQIALALESAKLNTRFVPFDEKYVDGERVALLNSRER